MLYLALLKAVLPAESIKNACAPNTPAHLLLSVKVALIPVNNHTFARMGNQFARLGHVLPNWAIFYLIGWVKMDWVACDNFTIWAVCQMKLHSNELVPPLFQLV